jgi:hypothetical protein
MVRDREDLWQLGIAQYAMGKNKSFEMHHTHYKVPKPRFTWYQY